MSAYSDKVIADGAGAFWRLGELSGNTARSEVGSFNGTITGGVQLGQPGSGADGNPSMLFTGNGWIDIPNGTFLGFGLGSFSAEFWAKRGVPVADDIICTTSGTATTSAGFAVYRNNGTDTCFFASYNTTGALNGVASVNFPNDGLWHHYVAVLRRGSPDSIQLYLDGVAGTLVNLTTSGIDFTFTNRLAIGRHQTVATSWFEGWLDDLAVYPIALTPTQIATHFALAKSIQSPYSSQVIQDGAVAYWRLGETSGTVARDELGLNNGTISGGVILGQSSATNDGNKSMRFDGTSGRIAIAAGFSIVPFSVECWFRSTITINHAPIWSNRTGATAPGTRYVGIYQSKVWGFDNATGIQGIKIVDDGNWHHIVWTNDGNIGIIYIDGVFEKQQAQVCVVGVSSNSWIGYDQNTLIYWPSQIDELVLYNTVLTPAQIAQHYSLRSSQSPASVKLGTGSFQLVGGAVYVMPPRISYVTASGPLQGSNDPQFGSFVTLTLPGNIAAGFIRSNSNISVTVSPRR